jgi:TRAP-type mannitol/chloroaromatic compound transport system permease small subunit
LIRWYDYPAALLAADLLLTTFFTIPIVGAIIAYVMYEYGWEAYCQFRLRQEENR